MSIIHIKKIKQFHNTQILKIKKIQYKLLIFYFKNTFENKV